MSRLRHLGSSLESHWDSLRGSYWFVPSAMALAASALAFALLEVDARLTRIEAIRIPWIQDAGAEGARALLSTVAGSMITVTGVVFSITIVALTLASSQFGPRLLRNFLRDRGNQLVLGTFVATFLYSLLVLRAVEADRVPHVATAVAFGLAVTSVFVLIWFVHHAASSIQASSIVASVADEIACELPTLFPEELGRATRDADASADVAAPAEGSVRAADVVAASSGYLRVVGGEALLAAAVEHDLRIELLVRPGDFVADGDALARVAPAERADEAVLADIGESFVLGTHRTPVQDLGFLTDQLVEMAVRALSPGINDPSTAVACVRRLGVVIGELAGRRMPSPERRDADGAVRVVAPATTFDGVVSGCLDPIRPYGARDADVVAAVLSSLAAAMLRCPSPARRDVLATHAREWLEGFARSDAHSDRDRARIDDWALRVAGARVQAEEDAS